MIIVDNRDKRDIFGSLKDGDVVYVPGHETYIMKIFPVRCDEDGNTYNAVSLSDGDTFAMEKTDPVIRVNSKLVVGEEA
jgi:hypothetical protein